MRISRGKTPDAPKKHTSKLKLKTNKSELHRLNTHLTILAKEWALPPKTVFDLTITLEELVGGIIKYSKPNNIKLILLTFLRVEKMIILQMQYDGNEFNPLEILDAADDDSGGGTSTTLGVNLINALTNSIQYSRKKINFIVIQKKITAF